MGRTYDPAIECDACVAWKRGYAQAEAKFSLVWETGTPPEAGYYLVTMAPGNHDSIHLRDAQDYAAEHTSLAWYNPSNGWWGTIPGTKRSENLNDAVTHWAHRPVGATPTAVQFAALPKKSHASWYDDLLAGISRELVFDQRDLALELIEALRARIEER
jgi:hypothetical protein